MYQEKQSLSFSQFVNAPPEQVFYACTNASALREWLCDASQAVPRPGGRLYLWWNSGYYVAGEFTAVEPDQKVAFTWQGRGEPGRTGVEITLQAQSAGTLVKLEHRGLDTGSEWDQARREIQQGWESGLENLASVLETGQDLRFVRRPMLGIFIGEFNPELAERLKVPVAQGIRLEGTVEGMGAAACGLQKDDVIISMAGRTIQDNSSLPPALQGRRAGDVVEVQFYRGPAKHSAQMTLSGRPLPDIPATAAELADAVGKLYEAEFTELSGLFTGVTDAEASRPPEPGEWSAKEVLAHLIIGERGWGDFMAELIAGQERWYDDTVGNSHEQTRSIVTAFPTAQALLDELKCSQAATLAFINDLPPALVARKGSYWRLAFGLLSPPSHTVTHVDQIRRAIQPART